MENYDKSDISQTVRSMAVVSQSNLVVLEQKEAGAVESVRVR